MSCYVALRHPKILRPSSAPEIPQVVWPRGSPFHWSAFRICRISRPRSAQEILQVVWPRGSPFQGSAFRICRISRPRSAQEFCKFCRWRVLSLTFTCWEVDFSQRTNARDVGRRYMRFFCWINLATDGSKCNKGHKFLNRKNPRQLPIRQNRINPHFGQCRKNRSNCLYKGQ